MNTYEVEFVIPSTCRSWSTWVDIVTGWLEKWSRRLCASRCAVHSSHSTPCAQSWSPWSGCEPTGSRTAATNRICLTQSCSRPRAGGGLLICETAASVGTVGSMCREVREKMNSNLSTHLYESNTECDEPNNDEIVLEDYHQGFYTPSHVYSVSCVLFLQCTTQTFANSFPAMSVVVCRYKRPTENCQICWELVTVFSLSSGVPGSAENNTEWIRTPSMRVW